MITREEFQRFLIDTEGVEEAEETYSNEINTGIENLEISEDNDMFLSEMGEIDGFDIISILNDQSIFHAITK